MVGEAGVGLFYLRLGAPEVPGVLLPGPPPPARALELGEEVLLESAGWWRSLHFPRTTSVLRCAGVEPATVGDPTPDDVVEGLERQVGMLPPAAREAAGDALALEATTFALLCDRPPFVDSFLQTLLRRGIELLGEHGTRVIMAPSSRLLETAYDWDALDAETPRLSDVERRGTRYLIHRVDESYEIRRLIGLVAEMYSLLREPIGVSALLDRLLAHLLAEGLLESSSGAEAEAVRERLLDRLRQAYAAGEIEIVERFELLPRDIDSATCMRCGECCRLKISIPGDATYAEFLREILEEPLRAHYPQIEIRYQDDRATPHVVVDLGDCRHLRRAGPRGPEITCAIYERRPAFCARFNCAAWWREMRSVGTGLTAADRLIEKVARIRAVDPTGER
jgi:Fe-S-cluster containining protein